MSNNKIRWEIQGLRALAVLAVVIFHISPEHLPGGYIGVDIFFVISGYLIMGHIWKELKNDTFSFVGFYSRRVKRLFPALLFMIVISWMFAWQLLLPGEFAAFCKSIISSLLYVSNFWFYSKSGYFDSELHNSLLLHTWSLSVEEQFYIFTPILLYFLYRKNIPVVATLLVISLVSLVFSEALLHFDESLSFYASPTRFWQFMVGGLLSIHFTQNRLNRGGREVVCLICLLGLAYYMFFVSGADFPGLKAVLPTLATAAIIYACQPQDISYRVLVNPVAKFFGNISYSLYLWHWPVIIIIHLSISPQMDLKLKLVALGLSVVLGYLSYVFIENRFRQTKSRDFGLGPLWSSVALSCAFVAFALFIPKAKYTQYSSVEIEQEKYLSYPATEYRDGQCFLSSKSNNFNYYDQKQCITATDEKFNILLIGDSHAAHWYAAMNSYLTGSQSLTQVTASGCRPVIQTRGEKRCTDLILWAYRSLINEHRFDRIVLSGRWKDGEYKDLIETVDFLKKYTADIVVLGPIIEYKDDLPRLMVKLNSNEEIARLSRYEKIKSIDRSLSEALLPEEAKYISVLDTICPTPSSCINSINNIPIQFDYGHLTYEGARLLLSKMDIVGDTNLTTFNN